MGHSFIVQGGISLKPEYFKGIAGLPSGATWLEVHPENYMIEGGPRLAGLLAVANRFPISLHGVGASLGGPDPVPVAHLESLKKLVDQIEPVLVSEHAAWSAAGDHYFAELLPLPRTHDTILRMVNNIDRMQNYLGRAILIENPANYLSFLSELDEPDFLAEILQRSGCGLLLDVNNVYVSANNCGLNARDYIRALPSSRIGEIHIAGYTPDENLGDALLIDSHAAPVAEAVWTLLAIALEQTGEVPVLIERDANLPPLEELLAEKARADSLLRSVRKEVSVATTI